MIRYTLNCDKGHTFESWFANSAAYDKQAKRSLIDLPGLRFHQGREGDHGAAAWPQRSRRRALRANAGAGARRRTAPLPPAPVAMMSPRGARAAQQAQGTARPRHQERGLCRRRAFPKQARKIHYGEAEHRSIYGEASPEEAKELHEEGIDFHPLPVLPDEFN